MELIIYIYKQMYKREYRTNQFFNLSTATNFNLNVVSYRTYKLLHLNADSYN